MKTLYQKSKTCLLIIVTLIGIVWGCKKTEKLAAPPPPAITVTASVAGNVSDLNNAPVSGALVAAGASITATDTNGQFTLRDIQLYKDAGFVKVTKAGYFTGSRTFLVNGNTTNNIKIQLLPKTVSGTIASSSGGNVDVTGGAKINFTASSFMNEASNTSYSGDVAVAGYYLNPADANFREYMPGDLRGVSTANKEGIVKSFGMLSVEMNDAAGQKLQLAEGKTATITIPIPSAMQAAAPATISLWYFDETKGIWKEEGTATKQSTSYVGVVSHFSFWNAGEQGADVQIDATFKNDSTGLALTNKLIAITSVNFGTTKGYTDNKGKISGLVPANENLVLKLFDDCGVINYTKNIGPFNTNTDLGNINVSFRSSCSLFNGTVNGTVINCSNAAVTNGHVKVTAGNNTFNATINNGGFSISYSYFSNSISTATLTAYDSNTGDSSKPVSIDGLQGSVNTGQVIACTSVTSAPVAGFTYSVSGPFVPVTISFSNTSTNAISWMWDFGDGVTSTVQNPSHTYSTAGDYTVKLIATGPGKTDSTLKILHLISQTDAYIILTLHGVSYSWVPPSDSVYGERVADTSGSFYTHVLGGGDPWVNRIKSISFNIGTGNNIAPGNYPISILSTLNDTTFTSSFTNANSLTTNVTEYGIVNGYITGTASGNMALYEGSGSGNPVIVGPFSCSYRIKRIQ